jgi:Tfp pilus assembly protein PilO
MISTSIVEKVPQVLRNFFLRLSKREKIIFCVAIGVASLLFLDRLAISPVFDKMAALNEKIRDKRASIKRTLRILAQKQRIEGQKARFPSYSFGIGSQEEGLTALLREIENLANKTSVYLIDVKPTGSRKEEFAQKYLVSIKCEAQMEQLIYFIYNIEKSDRLLTIEKYRINPKTEESSIANCSMVVAQIVLP